MAEQSGVTELLRTNALLALDELFNEVHGMMLDPQEPMFRTVDEISAEEASRQVGPDAACLAAQVEHTAFYIDVLLGGISGADWASSWALTGVTDEEWTALKARLATSYEAMRNAIATRDVWDDDFIGMVLCLIGHNGYHLGQIREGMAALRRPA